MFFKKRLAVFSVLFMFLCIETFARGKTDSLDLLIRSGSVDGIKNAIKKNPDTITYRLGNTKDNLLMKAIEYGREKEVIDVLLKSGIPITKKNKLGQTAVSYACAYSPNAEYLENILTSQTSSHDRIRNYLMHKDKTGKYAAAYAETNDGENVRLTVRDRLKNADIQTLEKYTEGGIPKIANADGLRQTRTRLSLVPNDKTQSQDAKLEEPSSEIAKVEKPSSELAKVEEPSSEIAKVETSNETQANEVNEAPQKENEFPEIAKVEEPSSEIAKIETPNEMQANEVNEVPQNENEFPEIAKADEAKLETKKEKSLETNEVPSRVEIIPPANDEVKNENANIIVAETKEVPKNKSNEIAKQTNPIVEVPKVQPKVESIEVPQNNFDKVPQNEVPKNVRPRFTDEKKYLYDYAEENDEVENASEPSILDELDKNGVTSLMHAIKTSNDWACKKLLASGANVNARDSEGWTPLMYAVRYQNNTDLVKLLLEHGANVNTKNNYNVSAVAIAAKYSENPEIVSLLLYRSNRSENEMLASLVYTIIGFSQNENVQLAKLNLFLNQNVYINRFYKGKTPLMYAAEYSPSTKVIHALLENGANPTIKNADGLTSFDFAKKNKMISRDAIFWQLNE